MARIGVILLALTIDLIWGDLPNQLHPVAWMGHWLGWGRSLAPPRRRFWFGTSWTLMGMLLFALPVWKAEGRKFFIPSVSLSQRSGPQTRWPNEAKPRLSVGRTSPHPSSLRLRSGQAFILYSLLLTPVFAYRNLRRAVTGVAEALADNNLSEARRHLSWHLVSRDTGDLTKAEVAGAAIESLAENLTDSLTAPLLAYAGGGLGAAWAYRYINTADAMWGYHTPEFEELGKFPARLDDVLNWLPARLTGWLLVGAAWLMGESASGAARTMLAQNGRTASPNSGWTMSAMAGALGVTLNKRGVYTLEGGQGRLDTATIQRALRLADICAGLIVLLSVLVAWVRLCLPLLHVRINLMSFDFQNRKRPGRLEDIVPPGYWKVG